MKKPYVQWLFFTIFFALIPLLIFLMFCLLFDNSISNIRDKCFHELFFYSIMVSAITINDLINVKSKIKETAKFIVAIGFILLLLIASTSIYGTIVFNDNFINENIISKHIDRMFTFSIIFGFFTTTTSLIVTNWRYSK